MDDPMQDRDNWGWQATATSMRERTTYLWKNNPIPINVTFAVGPERQKELIGAHKDILAISSEVFYSMFYGPVTKARDPNDPIVDDDIDPQAFRLMLKFLYTESVIDDEWTDEPFSTGVELAFQTMQAAGKYGIPALYLICRDHILNDIQETFTTSERAAECGILYALYARNPEWNSKLIIAAVWREIDAFTEAVLHVSDQVLRTVDETFMLEFLTRTTLNVSKEIMLYNFAVRWARLRQEGLQTNGTLKDAMRNLCKVLRFSSMSEQEWLDGPVKDGLYALDELKGRVAAVDGTTSRSVHDPPAIIKFEIYEGKERSQAVYEREIDLGQLEIQTQTEDNHVLTKLVERCVRKQMESNGADSPMDLSIDLLYKDRDLFCDGLDEDDQVDLNKEEMDMLTNGGQLAGEMKLGLGDVAVGFTLASKYGYPDNKLWNMYLVFVDESGKLDLNYSISVNKCRLFYLGRLTTGQCCLDTWSVSSHRRTIMYDVTYEKKTLDVPAKKRKLI